MLTLRYARQTRAFLFPPSALSLLLFSTSAACSPIHPYAPSSSDSISSSGSQLEIQQNEAVNCFREWFMSRSRTIPLFDRIFEILRTEEEASLDLSLSRLKLHLTESLILDVLRYRPDDVLSCLKFFDWTGRQLGFHHTRATFNAMFKILSKAKLMSLMLDFLQTYAKQKYNHKAGYHNILVIGYAIAGKCETALVTLGKMRFSGVDMDSFSYHVLMNSLVEHGFYVAAEMVERQVRDRGFQNEFTYSIMMKSFCKQNMLERASEYLNNLVQDGGARLNGVAVGTYVDALCKCNQFERAAKVIEEFQQKGCVSVEHAYGVWIKSLIIAGKLDAALQFLKDKQAVEEYVPDVFRYNMLICKLLRRNRIEDVFDLLVDMKERNIVPDVVTMNAVLCLLCKVGRVDIALGLYDSRAELGLSVNYMAYNYLINTLVGGDNIGEAFHVLRRSVDNGYSPGPKTLSIIADSLCREGKLDEMDKFVHFVIEKNMMPKKVVFDKYMTALCRASKIEEAYLIYDMLKQVNNESQNSTCMELIRGSIKSGRGDIATRLLFDMLERGHSPSRKLVRGVITCLLETDKSGNKFFALLEMVLACPRCQWSPTATYNFFIDGAGHAQKPELARQVYEVMKRSGVEPGLKSTVLLFLSYLRCGQNTQALHLFNTMSKKWPYKKLWRAMIVGLAKADKPEYASYMMGKMKAQQLRPTVECYEEVIKAYCTSYKYKQAIELVNEMTQMGRHVTSFIGNAFLFHALKDRNVYGTWVYLSHKQRLTPECWMLGHTIGVFSGVIKGVEDVEALEKLIGQSFNVDMYTRNLMLRRISRYGIDQAFEYLNKLRKRGCEPNQWTYNIIVLGLAKNGRFEEARRWGNEMIKKGFELTEYIIDII